MRPGFLILAAVLPPGTAFGADSGLDRALESLAKSASTFWRLASGYTGRETLRQRAIISSKRRLHVGAGAAQPPAPEFSHREIVSEYAFSSFREAPEALREFRVILLMDGKIVSAPRSIREVLDQGGDKAKKELITRFENANLAVSATDFSQLILLFRKANLVNYSFEARGSELVGAERALVLDFGQATGGEALRLAEPGKVAREPLRGQIWIRAADGCPLRIALNSVRRERGKTVRDDARVDYEPRPDGMILPAAVVYRRFVDDQLRVENTYQYADWRR